MPKWDNLKLQEFLTLHPSMRLKEFSCQQVIVEGNYFIDAQLEGFEPIRSTYQLQIIFPINFPRSLPSVRETDNRIPRSADYHTYEDGSFCLGSDIKLKLILYEYPTVIGFFDEILDPFLYAIGYKSQFNLYPFGDLEHGEDGLIDDYQRLFNVKGKASVLRVLHALGKRKREANKLPCPCGCRSRIGKCAYRYRLERWRQLDKSRWFREHVSRFTPVQKPKKSKYTRKKGVIISRKR